MRSYPLDFLLHLLQHCKLTNQLDQIHTLFITTGQLLPSIPSTKTTILWNTIIRSQLQTPNPLGSIFLYKHMLQCRILPNNHTFPSLIKSCVSTTLITGRIIQAHIIKYGLLSDDFINSCLVKFYGGFRELGDAYQAFDEIPQPDIVSCNAMLDAFCRNADFKAAHQLFDEMPMRNVVSWTTLINGFAKNGFFKEALLLFKQMQGQNGEHKVIANEATLVSILCACANLGAIGEGRAIHGYIIRSRTDLTAILGTAVIDVYGKGGCVRSALQVFDETRVKEVCTWNSIISSLGSHGLGEHAIEFFWQMQVAGFSPNEITFVGVLTACAREGFVELGFQFFQMMITNYGIVARMEHYGCMVDLMGRAGLLEEAMEFIRKMPLEPGASVWGALLGACKLHGNVGLGDNVGQILLRLQPRHCGRYIVLSNIYAAAERWGEAADVRGAMAGRGIKKTAGYSLLSCTEGTGTRPSTFKSTHFPC